MNTVLDRVTEHGRPYQDPLTVINWEKANPSLPWLPRSLLLSKEFFGSIDEDEFLKLSRAEFTRLC